MCTFFRDVAHVFFFLYILEDTAQRLGNVETRTGQVEDQVHILEGNFEIRHVVIALWAMNISSSNLFFI